jgi:hypothetical protein
VTINVAAANLGGFSMNITEEEFMKSLRVTLSVLAILSSPMAFADNTGKYYVGFDYGSASYSGVTVSSGTYPDPAMANIAVGYHVSDTVAAELGYNQYVDSTLPATTIKATVSATSLHAALVGSYPIIPQVEFIGKLGVSNNNQKITATYNNGAIIGSMSNQKTDLYFSVGAQLYLTQQLLLRGQYENFGSFGTFGSTGNDMKATGVSMGVIYNF